MSATFTILNKNRIEMDLGLSLARANIKLICIKDELQENINNTQNDDEIIVANKFIKQLDELIDLYSSIS